MGDQILKYAGGGNFDRPATPSTLRLPRNKQLMPQIGAAIDRNASLNTEGQSALSEYIAKYLAQNPEATARAGQETSNLDRYYNGGVEGDLASLRAARTSAIEAAARRGGDYAIAASNRGRLAGSDGGPSSYDTRLLLSRLTDVNTSAAVDEANQARSDYGYLQNARLGLTGGRQGIEDQLLARMLTPTNLRQAQSASNISNIQAIEAIDQGNTNYGVNVDDHGNPPIAGGVYGSAAGAASQFANTRSAPAPVRTSVYPDAYPQSQGYTGGSRYSGGGEGDSSLWGGGDSMGYPAWDY